MQLGRETPCQRVLCVAKIAQVQEAARQMKGENLQRAIRAIKGNDYTSDSNCVLLRLGEGNVG